MTERRMIPEYQTRRAVRAAIFAIAGSDYPVFANPARRVLESMEGETTGASISLEAHPEFEGPQLTDFRLEYSQNDEGEDRYHPAIIFNPHGIAHTTPAALKTDVVRTLILADQFDTYYEDRLFDIHWAALSGQHSWTHFENRTIPETDSVPDMERKILYSMTDVPYLTDFGLGDVRVLHTPGYQIDLPILPFIGLREEYRQEIYDRLIKQQGRAKLMHLAIVNRDQLAILAANEFIRKLNEPKPKPKKGRYNIHA